MMPSVLRSPRRKKHCKSVLYQSLPIPFEGCGPDTWPVYEALYHDRCVVVENMDSMFQLYNMGYFGKGVLSRGGLTFSKQNFTHEGERILSKHRYLRHCSWEQEARRFDKEGTSENMSEPEVVCSGNKLILNQDGLPLPTTGFESRKRDNKNSSDLSIKEGLLAEAEIPILILEGKEEEDQSWLMKTKDPFPLWECLQLGIEETFFLAFGLGCLTVIDRSTGKKFGLTKLWQKFSEDYPSFIKNYVAYHYFRSKGWVVKDGLKYGTDFLLYKDGPPFYHGTYSVIVTMIDEETLKPIDNFGNRSFTWPSLAGLNRVNERVAKDLLFCEVVRPSSLSDHELQCPTCIPEFRVQEILMRRWVSNQEREKKENDSL